MVKMEPQLSSVNNEVIEILDSESDGGDDQSDEEEDPKRISTTEAERAWMDPRYEEYIKLPQNPRNPKVKAFKEKFADDFVKTFKFKEGKIQRHRNVSFETDIHSSKARV